MSIGVYKITNIKTGKFYIGSSVNIEGRIKGHFKDLELNTHRNQHLQNSYNKYGKDAFIWSILEITDEKNLRIIEDKYIKETKCYERNIGYNIAKGAVGSGRDYFTEETLEKLRGPKSELAKLHIKESLARRGGHHGKNNPRYGKTWSEEWKKEQSKRLTNNPGVLNSPRFKGHSHSESSKRKTRCKFRNNMLQKLQNFNINLLNDFNWLFCTNNRDKNCSSKVIINKNNLNQFMIDCENEHKHGAFVVPFNDDQKTNLYVINDSTFLLMKDLLDRFDRGEIILDEE